MEKVFQKVCEVCMAERCRSVEGNNVSASVNFKHFKERALKFLVDVCVWSEAKTGERIEGYRGVARGN